MKMKIANITPILSGIKSVEYIFVVFRINKSSFHESKQKRKITA
jgi:hypothetical protein